VRNLNGRIAPGLDANKPARQRRAGKSYLSDHKLEGYRPYLAVRSLGFSRTQIRSLGGGADQFTIAGGEPNLGVHQLDYAFYQQNSYSLTETLGLSFGVRYENQTI